MFFTLCVCCPFGKDLPASECWLQLGCILHFSTSLSHLLVTMGLRKHYERMRFPSFLASLVIHVKQTEKHRELSFYMQWVWFPVTLEWEGDMTRGLYLWGMRSSKFINFLLFEWEWNYVQSKVCIISHVYRFLS